LKTAVSPLPFERPAPGCADAKEPMKRVFLFILTNLAVMLVLGVVVNVLGINRFLTANGMDLGMLLAFAAVMGFGGAFISLLMSKTMAKWSTGAEVITQPRSQDEAWILDTVRRLSERAGIAMPEVAIYEGEPNAFATGAFKDSALVAVSTGLLAGMTRDEVEAVLGHEVAHIANGDMVTLTLIQGVLNTFVVFLSRVIGMLVDNALRRNDEESSGPGMGYYISSIVLELVFGVLASIIVAWFSRQREFRADAGSAHLVGRKQPMINALARLGQMQSGELPASVAAFGITSDIGKLFASHPPLEERIAVLQASATQ
jgi:heat shock protein HtpX